MYYIQLLLITYWRVSMNRISLKLRAKEIVADGKPSPIVFSVLYVLVMVIIGLLSAKLISIKIDQNTLMHFIVNSDIEGFYDFIIDQAPSPAAFFLNTLLMVMKSVIDAGFVIFALNLVKGASASLWNLMDGFGMFLRIVWLSILEYIFILLWTMLFIIPGFIAFYRYRQALYLLIEHPEMSAYECIKESSRLMKGHKAELFTLDLSFIGWWLLSALPIIGYLVNIWFAPFYKITMALYYRQLIYTPHGNPEGSQFV